MTLYKYMDSNTAKLVLENRSLRASRNTSFNDPFDVLIDNLFGPKLFDDSQHTVNDFINSILNDTFISPYENDVAYELVNQTLKVMTRMEIDILTDGIIRTVNTKKGSADTKEVLELIKNQFTDDAIMCFSRSFDNVSMWSHYSNNHKGVVIGFNHGSNSESFFSTAENVRYSNDRPLLYATYYDLLRNSLFIKSEDLLNDYVKKITLSKSEDWMYEKESRIVISHKLKNDVDFVNISYERSDLEVIYFGCRCTKKDVLRISNIARAVNPQVIFFKMETDKFHYKLVPIPIGVSKMKTMEFIEFSVEYFFKALKVKLMSLFKI